MEIPVRDYSMIEYKFSKAFLTEKDLLKEIPVSRATFHRWQREWIANGNDPRDMGKILIKGSSIVYWDGQLWLKWFFNHKVNQKVKFDYEHQDKQRALVLVQNLKKKFY